jgi:N4-gp56 family major capsid protein
MFDKLTIPKTIPRNFGKTITFNRYTREAGITAALTEGTTPDSSQRTTTQVTASVSGYGDYYVVSDLLELTAIDDQVQSMIKTSAHQAADTLDLLIRNAITADATDFFANANTALSDIGSDDVMTLSDARKILRTLENSNVPRFSDGFYRAIIHPFQKFDVLNATAVTEWHDVVKYTNNVNRAFRGELGEAYGIRFMGTTNVFNTTTGTSANATAYYAAVAGDEGVASISVTQGSGKPKMFRGKAGEHGIEDPLQQKIVVGWKVLAYVAKVLESARVINWITGATQ